MNDTVIQKFELTKASETEWDIKGCDQIDWVKGHTLSRRNNFFYISLNGNENSPIEANKKKRSFKIETNLMVRIIYNYFTTPKFQVSKTDLMPQNIQRALEINHEAIHQLWLEAYWNK
jgi:hypothetical protein